MYAGLLLHRGNKDNCFYAPWSLPWCPRDARGEIYYFLIENREYALVPLPFQKAYRPVNVCIRTKCPYLENLYDFNSQNLQIPSPCMPPSEFDWSVYAAKHTKLVIGISNQILDYHSGQLAVDFDRRILVTVCIDVMYRPGIARGLGLRFPLGLGAPFIMSPPQT